MQIVSLLDKNQKWSARMQEGDPEFFHRLAAQQRPEFLWIGCSDSRVPANDIVGLMPGEFLCIVMWPIWW
jgi:carbonic anhydrase